MARHPILLGMLVCTACAASQKPALSSQALQPPAAPAGHSERRVVISLGRSSGTSSSVTEPDGTVHTVLHVLENGRGPHVEATARFTPDGDLQRFEARGHHELGNEFSARFERQGKRAEWQATEESGSRTLPGRAFYVPLAETPEVDGWLVRAALRNGGRLPLLPSGEAQVERVAEVAVTGAGASERKLAGYRISGLGLTPSYTWLNPDGSWFGSVSEWFSVVPEGWDASLQPLLDEQRTLERERTEQSARELAQPLPAAGLALTHARVLDVERGRYLEDHGVLVRDGKIADVAPSRKLRLPQGVKVLDLTGRTLMPGLWDMHVHLDDADGALHIASGVTSVRDVGNDPDKLDDYKQRYDAGNAIGPHVLRFGFIEGRNEKAASSVVTAETPEEARKAVQFFVDRKYEGVKIYNSVRPELVPLIAQAAHARGLRVTGHIPVHMLAHEAVTAGYDGIEHINMLFLNFFATHETDTRDTTRFTLVGDKAPELDLGSKPVQDLLALLQQKKTVVTPTLTAFESLYIAEAGKIIPGLESIVARLPPNTARLALLGGLPITDQRERYRVAWQRMLAMVKALYEAKISVVTGTDDLAGLMLHHELALFAQAGIPNAAILRMATVDAARSVGMAGHVGAIAKGQRADLAVVDGDPLSRIEDAGRVVSTLRAGVLFDAAAVGRTVSIQPVTPR